MAFVKLDNGLKLFERWARIYMKIATEKQTQKMGIR